MNKEEIDMLFELKENVIKADLIVHLIIKNARLIYDNTGLSMNNETTILEVIKELYPDEYNKRFKELTTNLNK